MNVDYKFYLPLVFAAAGLFLGTWPTFQCETIQFRQLDQNAEGLIILAGPYSYQTENAEELSDSEFVAYRCKNYGEASSWSSGQHMKPNDGLGFVDYEKDTKMDIVWAFSVIAPLFGSCIMVWSLFRLTYPRKGYQYLGFLYIVTAIFQGLILLVTSSSLCNDNPAIQYLEANNAELANTFSSECQIAVGYVMQASAVAFWILAAVAEFVVKDPV